MYTRTIKKANSTVNVALAKSFLMAHNRRDLPSSSCFVSIGSIDIWFVIRKRKWQQIRHRTQWRLLTENVVLRFFFFFLNLWEIGRSFRKSCLDLFDFEPAISSVCSRHRISLAKLQITLADTQKLFLINALAVPL